MSERVTLPRTVVDQVLEALGNVGLSGALAQAEQAQEALREALIDDESAYQRGYMDGMSKGRRDLVAEYPLERDLYDSKDWRCGGYAERVEWLHTMYEAARHRVSRCFLWVWSFHSCTLTAVYTPKAFILHAALPRHAFAHCGRFVTAASRRSPSSVSVSMRRAVLSHPLPVFALVSHYLTN